MAPALRPLEACTNFFFFSILWCLVHFHMLGGRWAQQKTNQKDEMILSHLDIVSINLHLSVITHTDMLGCDQSKKCKKNKIKIKIKKAEKKTSIRQTCSHQLSFTKAESFPVPCLQLRDQTTRSGRGIIAPGRLVLVPPSRSPCPFQSSAPRFPF